MRVVMYKYSVRRKISIVGIGLAVALIVAGSLYYLIKSTSTRADSVDWLSANATAQVDSTRDPAGTYPIGGAVLPQQENVNLGNDLSATSISVFQAKDFRMGVIGQQVYLGLNNENRMYPFDGFSTSVTWNWLISSHTDNFISTSGLMLPNIVAHLTTSYVNGVKHYNVADLPNSPAMRNIFLMDNGSGVSAVGAGISSNGEWLFADINIPNSSVHRFITINLETFDIRLIASDPGSYGYGFNPDYNNATAVSDDGRFVAVGGLNVGLTVYDLDGSCGDTSSSVSKYAWMVGNFGYTTCPAQDFMSVVQNMLGYSSMPMATAPSFQDGQNGQIEMLIQTYHNTNPAKWVQLTAQGYTPRTLEYLALGDSFSSGEGDVVPNFSGQNNYLPFTNTLGNPSAGIPEEMCHQSYRSYPFLLAQNMSIPVDQMASVACSGALVSKDYLVNTSYEGQYETLANIPRLSVAPSGSLPIYDAAAASNFIPGRISQLSFVEKYKPQVVTLTGGGNDVGFRSILENCVTEAIVQMSCDSASTIDGKAQLGQDIQNQYTSLVNLYQSIHALSPDTKIYVVGYPQFITSDQSCSGDGAYTLLTQSDREMINAGVTYLNKVISAAASEAGVEYVNVEDSLSGHELCDGTTNTDVNGVVNFGQCGLRNLGLNIDFTDNDCNSSFHPNARGQADLATAIESQIPNLLTANYSPTPATPTSTDISPTAYFADAMTARANEHYEPVNLSNPVVQKDNSNAQVNISTSGFQPNTPLTVSIHSDPETYPTQYADANGNFSANLTVFSDLAPGFHTLHVQGTAADGTSIDQWQIIQVLSDGTSELSTPCGFIPASGVDANMNGIDDACDPDPNSPPQLYRARTGDATRTYNGAPENPNYIYIERNTRASSLTGITGDYDDEGDGWAVVGVSQGTPYSATSVPDTGPIANFEVVGTGANAVPYVYTRAGGYGCVAWTPVSLSQVQQGQARSIQYTALNTNKCRQDDPSFDDDQNGIPDNQQPVYMARKGDPSVGILKSDGTYVAEDPTKLYIYRSFAAAETQLGISDYSPTGTAFGNGSLPIQPWNLLASTQTAQDIGTFDKIVMVTDTNGKPMPVILTKQTDGTCAAYEPASTDIIDPATQFSRDITQLEALPQGATCD